MAAWTRLRGESRNAAAPAINQSGRLYIQGDVLFSDLSEIQGIFTCEGKSVRAVVLQGDTAPDTGGLQVCFVEEGSLSDDGRVVFLQDPQQQQQQQRLTTTAATFNCAPLAGC